MSLTLENPRLTAGTELPLVCIAPLGALPLDGEHDCRLTLPGGPGSTEEDRELGAPGRPLVVESGLSGNDVLKFGGALWEKPGISEGFHGLDFTVGEAPRDGAGFLDTAAFELLTAGEDFTGGALDGVDSRRVGVAALDAGFDGGMTDAGLDGMIVDVDFDVVKEGLEVGVEDLAVDLDGVDDLVGTVDLVADDADLVPDTTGLAIVAVDRVGVAARLVVEPAGLFAETEGLVDDNVALEVGVEDLEGLDAPVSDERPVGVAGLEPGPPDDEGLRIPAPEELNPEGGAGCFDTKLPLVAGCD